MTQTSEFDSEPQPMSPLVTTPPTGSKAGAAGVETPSPPATPPAPPQVPSYSPGPPPEPKGPRVGKGAVAGLVLIGLGVVALIGQVVPGLAWWSLWPLIIVVSGLVQAFTPGHSGWTVDRMFDGFVTVAIGLVILAITTGVVGISVIWQIIALWPVLLIAIGLDLLGKAMHTSWVRALGSTVVIAALAYAVAISAGGISGTTLSGTTTEPEEQISQPVGRIREGNLLLDAGVSEVNITSGKELVEAEGSSPWGSPVFSVERSGTQAYVDLSLGEPDNVVVWPRGQGARLDAQLSDRVLWDMQLNTGVTTLKADLEDVRVRSVELKPGVADCSLKLGEVPRGVDEAEAIVKAGISSVSVLIPEGAEARIVSDSGLTAHSIDDSFRSTGSRIWETEGFESAQDEGTGVWLITIKSGIGSVSVDAY